MDRPVWAGIQKELDRPAFPPGGTLGTEQNIDVSDLEGMSETRRMTENNRDNCIHQRRQVGA
jgi:hypothetical protein